MAVSCRNTASELAQPRASLSLYNHKGLVASLRSTQSQLQSCSQSTCSPQDSYAYESPYGARSTVVCWQTCSHFASVQGMAAAPTNAVEALTGHAQLASGASTSEEPPRCVEHLDIPVWHQWHRTGHDLCQTPLARPDNCNECVTHWRAITTNKAVLLPQHKFPICADTICCQGPFMPCPRAWQAVNDVLKSNQM